MSLFEVLIALALLAIVFVSVLAVLASSLRTNKKDFFRDKASSTATLLLNRVVLSVQTDSPEGIQETFWEDESPTRAAPFQSGVESNGDLEFQYEICTTTIKSPDGSVYGAPNRRLKQIDVYLTWGDSDSRTGYGSTLFHDRQLLSEASGDAI